MRLVLAADENSETNSSRNCDEQEKTDDPNPACEACRAVLSLSQPWTLLLLGCTFLVHDHTEAPPEIVTSFAAAGKERLLLLTAQDRLGSELDIPIVHVLRGTREHGLDGSNRGWERVRSSRNVVTGGGHPWGDGTVHTLHEHKRARMARG